MKQTSSLLLICTICGLHSAAAEPPRMSFHKEAAATIDQLVRRDLSDLLAFYQDRHAHPELSLHEEQSAKKIAERFAAAGYPDAADGLSMELVDSLVAHGSEEQVATRLLELLDMGMGELMAMPLIVGDDVEGSTARAFSAVALAASRAS